MSSKNKKCFISENDPFCFTVYSQEETEEMFGKDFVDEDEGDQWDQLPEELYEEYRNIEKKFWELNKKIREIKSKK